VTCITQLEMRNATHIWQKNSKITNIWKPRFQIEGNIKKNLKERKSKMFGGIQLTRVKY